MKIDDITNKEKPVVLCSLGEFSPPKIGKRADVVGVEGHPNPDLNGIWVTTSKVLALFDDGFETLNTFYKFK